jgi:hypothetical protein
MQVLLELEKSTVNCFFLHVSMQVKNECDKMKF